MLAIISPAKTMQSHPRFVDGLELATEPRFMEQTSAIVSMMVPYSARELETIFKVSAPIARELRSRFLDFGNPDIKPLMAVDSYDGVVYKHFKPKGNLSKGNLDYLQSRMRISSLLYGLLRPLDLLLPYRMEGFVRLSDSDEKVDSFWREHQTQTLIDDVRSAGGTLLYLASREEQKAFHWAKVRRSVRVIDFQFLQSNGEKMRQVVIYTKMARGEMIRYMMEHKVTEPDELKSFEWGGYTYRDELSSSDVWVWVMEV